MKSNIDANNLSSSEETLIYISRINIIWKVFILIALAVSAIYNLTEEQFIISLLAFAIFLFQLYYVITSIKKIDEIQFRINSKGIQYKNLITVAWHNIENERVVTEYTSDDNSNNYFIYNVIDSGKVMRFNLRKFNISKEKLQLALIRQRNSFNTENNIL
jgi:hypothetical protein